MSFFIFTIAYDVTSYDTLLLGGDYVNEKLMTVGEIAREAGVSVRTLQYYDQYGLLKPSSYSEGGNRLYSSKDLVMLHQIISLKYLGLSLEEIKQRLISFDIPGEVLEIVQKQKEKVISGIENLKNILSAIELFENEITEKNSVDFTKYARIISALQYKWDDIWFLDKLEKDLYEHVILKYDKESGQEFYKYLINMTESAIQLQEKGIRPESPAGQELAAVWWNMVTDFTGGDDSLLTSIFNVPDKLEGLANEFTEKWKQVEGFVGMALEKYLRDNQIGYPDISNS